MTDQETKDDIKKQENKNPPDEKPKEESSDEKPVKSKIRKKFGLTENAKILME